MLQKLFRALIHRGYLGHIISCFKLLSSRGKFFYLLIIFIQTFGSLLDLVGLALIMKVILGFQPGSNGGPTSEVGSNSLFSNFLANSSSGELLIWVVTIFVFKGFLALTLHTFTIKLMASETLRLVKRISETVFENRTTRFRDVTNQDISYALYNASDMVFRDSLVPVSVIISDFMLLGVIGINLYLSAEILFLPTLIYFLSVFVILRSIERRSNRISFRRQMKEEILGRTLIHETTVSLRELYVSSNLGWMTDRILAARKMGTSAGAKISIGQLRPKYFYEIALFGGVGVIALVTSLSGNSTDVLTFLTLFIVSASRMIPSLLRIQFYLSIFQKSKEQTNKIFEILRMMKPTDLIGHRSKILHGPPTNSLEFTADISIKNLYFSYNKAFEKPTIEDISLTIAHGQTVAIVGSSGAGKSTLVDLLLGYQQPTSGEILISGLEPRKCFQTWPGKVAYIPQKVSLYSGSIYGNIAVGLSDKPSAHHTTEVERLLTQVGLGDFLKSLPNGLDSEVSEFGSNLSGGQTQRIGIARALFSNPSIMVFDESTSSLDSTSEDAIMRFLLSYKGKKTMIFVAHRLSTIRTADRIIYLKAGKFIAEGNFETLQELVPEFKQQVSLLNVTNNTTSN
jgi:ABC-type multidrug transport system fused ATPase/permease subunit